MDKKNLEKINIINGSFGELASIFKPKDLFNIFLESEKKVEFKKIFGKGQICIFNYIFANKPVKCGSQPTISNFFTGRYSANNIRKKYLESLMEESKLKAEIERIKNDLNFLECINCDFLNAPLEKYLGAKENVEVSVKENRNAYGFANVKGYFDIINDELNNNIYGSSIKDRFKNRYISDLPDALARLIIMICLGGYVITIIDEILPPLDYDNNSDIRNESKEIYRQYKSCDFKGVTVFDIKNKPESETSKLYYKVKGLYDKTKGKEKENLSPELSYVYAKILSEVEKLHIHDKKDIDSLLKECVENCKKAIDNEVDVENIKELRSNVAYEIFCNKCYELEKINISEEKKLEAEKKDVELEKINFSEDKKLEAVKKDIIHFFKIAKENGHIDANNIVGELILKSGDNYKKIIENFNDNNKYTKICSVIKTNKIDLLDAKNKAVALQDILELAMKQFSSVRDGYAFKRMAQCSELMNDPENDIIKYPEKDIIKYWGEAYRRSCPDAKIEILKKSKGLADKIKFNKNDIKNNIFIVCGLSEENIIFIESIPSENTVILVNQDNKKIKNIFEEKFRIVQSIYEAFEEIDCLVKNNAEYNEICFVCYGADDNEKYQFVEKIYEYISKRINDNDIEGKIYINKDKVRLCVDFNEQMTELHIDRFERLLGENYLPVVDNMYEKNASLELLFKCPLFTIGFSDIKKKNEHHIAILGYSKTSVQIVKDMVSMCAFNMNDTYIIHIIDSDAENVKKILKSDCNEILNNNAGEKYQLEFHTIDVKYINMDNKLDYSVVCHEQKNNTENNEETKKYNLFECDYYVCASDDDLLNLDIAKKIRMWNMRCNKDYYNAPIIASLCKNKAMCQGLEGLVVTSSLKLDYPWYEGLNIVGFGAKEDYYSIDYIYNNCIKNWGYRVSLAYCDINNIDEVQEASKEFYKRWYNRDSSYLSALFMVYRIFTSGAFKKWTKWSSEAFLEEVESEGESINAYMNYISNPDNKEGQAKMEHCRWVIWMKSRGWKQASITDVDTYMEKGNKMVKHQLHVAKLHPYMVSWDELGDSIYNIIERELDRLVYNLNICECKEELIKEVEIIKKDIDNTDEKDLPQKLKQTIIELDNIKNNSKDKFEICINNLKEINNFSSKGLQKEMEEEYEKHLGNKLSGSIKANDYFIVEKTKEVYMSTENSVNRSLKTRSL